MDKQTKIKAFAAMGAEAVRSAGYSASALRSAGYSASDVLSAGYSKKDMEEWESIPKLKKPYTRLWEDIKAKKRLHNQSTFGPNRLTEENACKTACCTAGHLVNMAGDIGYKLRDKYDWSGAARLIHYKAHPTVPPQNFGGIPQDMAMAYIEYMATEVEGKKK